ncbi:MAG: polysaccharide deacetylase family protein [Alphaproteobacteria bacterium]|nr:polysaccharide deacetylase family protein [Alphaproteobacteria bacterium]
MIATTYPMKLSRNMIAMRRNILCRRPFQGLYATATILAGFLAASALSPKEALAQTGAAESAVVLVYQRFGEDDRPANSVKLSEFEAHITELTSGKYNVMALPDILAAIDKGEKLANRTVAITIDDTFRSVYEKAWPRLKKAGLPFTLFVATDQADLRRPAYMTWDEIRELRDGGVTIAAHTAAFLPVSEATVEELRADAERSLESFQRELGARPTLFAWPRGEMSSAASEMLTQLGFKAAFGYHSGSVSSLADRMMMPRFPMVGTYAKKAEFIMRVNTLALPLTDVEPSTPMLSGAAPTTFTFKIDSAAGRIRGFNCFHSSQGQLDLKEVGERRYEAALNSPGPKGIWRINCTMPTGGKRFRWWGMQYYSAG